MSLSTETGRSGAMMIHGIGPVYEALRSPRCQVTELWVAYTRRAKGIDKILREAESRKVPIRHLERSRLNTLTKNATHQGVAGLVERFDYADLDHVLRVGLGDPLLLVLDGIEDPRNLGALVRTADACGVWGVVIPKDRAAGVTGIVVKSSAGAVFHTPIMVVTNISNTLRKIKERGIWVIGATAEAKLDLYRQDLRIPLAVVIGGEGRGIRPLVRQHCDFLVSIPMKGQINSLNASVAGAVILYEVLRQRQERSQSTRHTDTF